MTSESTPSKDWTIGIAHLWESDEIRRPGSVMCPEDGPLVVVLADEAQRMQNEIERLRTVNLACLQRLDNEPCADAEKLLEAYDACWLADERLADREVQASRQEIAAMRERFNAARAAVKAAMRPAQPPGADLYLARNCLSNLYVVVARLGNRPDCPIDTDVQFAMREAAQFLGPPHSLEQSPYSAITKGEGRS